MRREDIFKPTIGNDSLYQDNDKGVRIVKITTSKNVVTRCSSTEIFINTPGLPHDWKNRNKIDLVSSIYNFQGGEADCNTDHYQVDQKVWEELAVSKQEAQDCVVQRLRPQTGLQHWKI